MTREEVIQLALDIGLRAARTYKYRGSLEAMTEPERKELEQLLEFANKIIHRDEALLRQALEVLGRYCKRPKGADFTMEVEEFRLYATEIMGLPAPANRSGLIEPTRSFAIAAQQGGAA